MRSGVSISCFVVVYKYCAAMADKWDVSRLQELAKGVSSKEILWASSALGLL